VTPRKEEGTHMRHAQACVYFAGWAHHGQPTMVIIIIFLFAEKLETALSLVICCHSSANTFLITLPNLSFG
jgi:hypothetical protein